MTPETILLRHAHPNFMDGNSITSQVFMPFPKDEGFLSVYDGDQISAEMSHQHYTQTLTNQSHSVWGVTKAEADAENVPAKPAPCGNFVAHATLDFNGKTDKLCRKTAKRLKALAVMRGCLYSSV